MTRQRGKTRSNNRSAHPWALLFPFGVATLGIAPHLPKLGDHLVKSHEYWYDGLIHMYLSWERFQSLTFRHGFFDFRWFAPYGNTGTYNEPAVTSGVLFGLLNAITPGEVWAFNLSMVLVLVLNSVALYFLIYDSVKRPWIAAIFSTVGALSPFAWVRYFHPGNTTIFWGIFGLYFLRRAVRNPTWLRCLLVPFSFTVQLYSSLYVGMYFVVPLLVFIPACLVEAVERKTFRRLALRLSLATLLFLPLLAVLHSSYSETREELGGANTYDYVSSWMPKNTGDLLPRAPIRCQCRGLGLATPQRVCRDELFPGRLVTLGALFAAVLSVVVFVRRFDFRKDHRRAIVLGALIACLCGSAFAWDSTLPFHLAVGLLLFFPWGSSLRVPAVRFRSAVFVASALLVTDVALNPSITLFAHDFSSVFRFLFYAVPGFDGLRSEYRIIILLPVFLAFVGAVAIRRLILYLRLRGAGAWQHVLLPLIGLWAVVDGQPAWQEYAQAPRTDRMASVLAATAALPDSAVIAIFKGRGTTGVTRYREVDGAYWDSYIMLHGHRQVTAKSTYKTPGSKAITWRAATLRDRGERLYWSHRLAYLFGATHLILDWSDRPAPPEDLIAAMFDPSTGASVVAGDRHMALVEIGSFPDTAHGPQPDNPVPGVPLEVDWRVGASSNKRTGSRAVDGDPLSVWKSQRASRKGDWVTFTAPVSVCVSGIAISPGLRIEGLPTAYDVEVWSGDGFVPMVRQTRWEVPEALIESPGTGQIILPFPRSVKTRRVRIRLQASGPWPWIIAEFKGFSGSCP